MKKDYYGVLLGNCARVFCVCIIKYIFNDRSDYWWSHIVLFTFSNNDWLENFRMSQNTFDLLCSALEPNISKRKTRMREPLPVKKRVAITLWFLATPVEYRTIGHLFGVARCTVCVVVHETCTAIVSLLLKRYICFPQGNELNYVVEGFMKKWDLPQCVGAIDGSHIPISAPTNNHSDYYNRKGFYSIIIQAIVDFRYRFIDVYCGWPGSVHDSRVFAHSSIFTRGKNGTLLPSDTRSIGGIDVPLYLVGDSAYPLLRWLMKPFPHNSNLSTAQRNYNYHQSRARIVVENTFGRLKARWRRLLKRLDMSVDTIPIVVTACCILNNLCEVHGDTFRESWLDDITETTTNQPNVQFNDNSADDGPKAIRDALVTYFSE